MAFSNRIIVSRLALPAGKDMNEYAKLVCREEDWEIAVGTDHGFPRLAGEEVRIDVEETPERNGIFFVVGTFWDVSGQYLCTLQSPIRAVIIRRKTEE